MKRNKGMNVGKLMILTALLIILGGCGNTGTQGTMQGQSNEETKLSEDTVHDEADQREETALAANTSAASTEVAVEEPEELAAEFDPNTDYDKYALVYYIIEDIDARFVATVSARDDGSEYEVHCSVDGEEQVVTVDKDLSVVSDKTGNLSYDAPLIAKKAIDADKWIEIEKD